MCSCIRSSIIYLLVLTHNPISRVQQYKVITSIRCFNINIYFMSPVCTRYIEQYFLSEPYIEQPCLSVSAAIIPPNASYIE